MVLEDCLLPVSVHFFLNDVCRISGRIGAPVDSHYLPLVYDRRWNTSYGGCSFDHTKKGEE